MAKRGGKWIKLFLDVDKGRDYRGFEESLREGKKSRKQRRQAEDTAFSQVIRLYIMLGQTENGSIDMKNVGDRLLAEDVMRESGDDLLTLFDRMAMHNVIDYDAWATMNVVSTPNAREQAELRQGLRDRSKAGNDAKREKARAAKGEP